MNTKQEIVAKALLKNLLPLLTKELGDGAKLKFGEAKGWRTGGPALLCDQGTNVGVTFRQGGDWSYNDRSSLVPVAMVLHAPRVWGIRAIRIPEVTQRYAIPADDKLGVLARKLARRLLKEIDKRRLAEEAEAKDERRKRLTAKTILDSIEAAGFERPEKLPTTVGGVRVSSSGKLAVQLQNVACADVGEAVKILAEAVATINECPVEEMS